MSNKEKQWSVAEGKITAPNGKQPSNDEVVDQINSLLSSIIEMQQKK